MKRRNVSYVLQMVALLTLSGCGRVIDWGTEMFYQGEEVKQFYAIPRQYIRTACVYDQFDTLGIFHALWLSDSVRTALADTWAYRQGKDIQARNSFLRRQLAENVHFISLYVLTSHNVTLGELNSDWSLFLQVDERNFTPAELKKVDLPIEYEAFFGKKYNRFKVAYLVKFNAKDVDGNSLLHENVQQMGLFFRSLEKETSVWWDIPFA